MRILFLALTFPGLCASAWAQADESASPDLVEIRSQTDGESSPPARIEDLGWLVGHWKGSGLGGASEEIIAAPEDGQMMGMFRQSDADGALQFYEFYHFAETDGSLILRIKHFNPDLTGWEEKAERAEFPLVEIGEQAAYFDGVTFALTEPGEMRAAVMTSAEGRADFRYTKLD